MGLLLARKTGILCQVLGLLLLLQLGACRREMVIQAEPSLLPCKVDGACDSRVIKQLAHFKKIGIKVITIGEDYLISIPARALFYDQTPRLNSTSCLVLDDVAAFLKQFRKVSLHVASYSSKYMSAQREHALTLARSRVVADYLLSQAVDTRLLFTYGLGSDKPIVRDSICSDASPNARIEITFRQAVA